ncbi:MAG: hypothetical protein ABJB22_03895 [Verrucomicrobiota bacterium]
MLAIAIASAILGVTLTSSMALQRTFKAVDTYFATHMQQIRIVDYLARDVKRGLSVTSSLDTQTVTVLIPRYIIQAGDSDATSLNIGTPRSPRPITNGNRDINYGDASNHTTSTVTYEVMGSSIVRKEKYTEDPNPPIITTVASSTDNLIPKTIDMELANTEYTTTSITFKPIFKGRTMAADQAATDGTVVYSTAYLRNQRRSIPTP